MKRLMYLSVTVLCFSLSALVFFHLGQPSAEAQGGGSIIADAHQAIPGGTFMATTRDGDVYSVAGSHFATQYLGTIPLTGGDAIAAMMHKTQLSFWAVTEFGDVISVIGAPFETSVTGNIFGGPVNVESSTWGRIKHDHKDGGQ